MKKNKINDKTINNSLIGPSSSLDFSVIVENVVDVLGLSGIGFEIMELEVGVI